MSGLPKKCYIITLNKEPVVVIYSSGAYAELIKSEMSDELFEDVYGIPRSSKTHQLEEQYEKEYSWDFIEIDSLSTRDAESRCLAIMKRKGMLDKPVTDEMES